MYNIKRLNLMLSTCIFFLSHQGLAKDISDTNQTKEISADKQPDDSSGFNTGKQPLGIKIYGGAGGFVNGSFLLKAKSDFYNGSYTAESVPSPTWGGVGGGGGAHLGIRWKALSLDIGYEGSIDQAEGKINGLTYAIEQTTNHMPLTLRLELPSTTVRPSIFGGLDWVSISRSSTKRPTSGFIYQVDTIYDDYTAWRFGLGIEIIVDEHLRIPLRFLANYAPTERENLDDVLELDLTNMQIRYKSEWVWQPQISLSVVYDFYTL